MCLSLLHMLTSVHYLEQNTASITPRVCGMQWTTIAGIILNLCAQQRSEGAAAYSKPVSQGFAEANMFSTIYFLHAAVL